MSTLELRRLGISTEQAEQFKSAPTGAQHRSRRSARAVTDTIAPATTEVNTPALRVTEARAEEATPAPKEQSFFSSALNAVSSAFQSAYNKLSEIFNSIKDYLVSFVK